MIALMLGAALIGAAWAFFNLYQIGAQRGPEQLRPLVWVIFAVPFFSFWGWLIAQPRQGWRALLVCLAIYFFSIFAAARLEQQLLGAAQARATGHQLYFQAVVVSQFLAVTIVAFRQAWWKTNADHDK